MEIEHEVGEGALEACTGADLEDKARSGDLGGTLEVEYAELFANLPVRLGGEVKGGNFSPCLLADVVVLGGAGWDGVVREVGQGLEQFAELEVRACSTGFEDLGIFFEGGGLSGDERDVGAFALEAAKLCGQGIALGFEGLSFGDGRTPFGIERGKSLEECGVYATQTEFFFDQREIRPHKR
jgi:hypothetical protein